MFSITYTKVKQFHPYLYIEYVGVQNLKLIVTNWFETFEFPVNVLLVTKCHPNFPTLNERRPTRPQLCVHIHQRRVNRVTKSPRTCTAGLRNPMSLSVLQDRDRPIKMRFRRWTVKFPLARLRKSKNIKIKQ